MAFFHYTKYPWKHINLQVLQWLDPLICVIFRERNFDRRWSEENLRYLQPMFRYDLMLKHGKEDWEDIEENLV